MKVAALVSGGVDSSVVVHLLKEQGVTPDIYYIRIGMEDEEGYIDCPAEEDIEITQWLAHHYGCHFEEVNLHKEYWDNVVSYTIDTVRRGLTPNPDVMCNKLIKFGAFVDRRGKDYDRIATGHYAQVAYLPACSGNHGNPGNNRLVTDFQDFTGPDKSWKFQGNLQDFQDLAERENSVTFLATAVDPVKDQTDFLSQLGYDQIRRLMFPIGGMMKSEVRTVAAQAALPSADRKDSQGICFLGKINYNDFLRRYLGEREGKIVELETGRVLGTHKGYWFHTIGQRKGLYLSGGPWFVVRKDIEENVLYVSQGYDPATAYGKEITLMGFHLLSGCWPEECLPAYGKRKSGELPGTACVNRNPGNVSDKISQDFDSPSKSWKSRDNLQDLQDFAEREVKFKIRHTPEFHQGHLRKQPDGLVLLESDEPIHGIAAGQYATIYDNAAHLVMATGMIV